MNQLEKLSIEKSVPGRRGVRVLPPSRPAASWLPATALRQQPPRLPEMSEFDVVRHYTRLSRLNFSLDTHFYPLGSCTMKYNPRTNERQAATPALAAAHPMLADELGQGALRLLFELQGMLARITGLDAVSVQPAAGAHGELTGMLIFHAYHRHRGSQRHKILIPDTAHGTNPASAALCGFRAVPVPSDERGMLDPATVAALMDEDTAGIMVTNPNTLGLFEERIREVADAVHARGGLVYGDGANMNAVLGVMDARRCGIDVLHLNLHKTFATPHGGGGPGAGPVCVTAELAPFLPVPRVVRVGDSFRLDADRPLSVGRIHAFHGNFGVLVRA